MELYLGVVRDEGITEEEIGAAQSVVMAVAAGRVNAQMREAERRVRKEAPENNAAKHGGEPIG